MLISWSIMRNIVSVDLYHVNCTNTDYIECKIAYWLWRTIPFTLLVIGLFGNVLNFVVLCRQRIRKYSTAVYLLFLAGSDIIFLLFGPLPDTIHGITGYRLRDDSIVFCKTRSWVIHTSAAFSVWLLVSLTIERFLLTKASVWARTRLTPKASFLVSMTILVLLATANCHFITGYKHYSSKEEVIKELEDELVNFPCNYSSREYMIFQKETWGIIVLVMFNVVPLIFILIGNVNIAVAIMLRKRRLNVVHPVPPKTVTQRIERPASLNRQTDREEISLREISRRQNERNINDQTNNTVSQPAVRLATNTRSQPLSATGKHNNPSRIKPKKSFSPNRMLFTLTIFFIVTTSPYCLYAILKGKLGELNDKDIAKWQLISVVVLIFAWCNYAFNFFLYFVSGTLFKQEWNKLLMEGKRKLRNSFGLNFTN